MRSMWKKYGFGSLVVASGMLISFTLATDVTEAKVTGLCSNCHTMHYSQNGAPEQAMGTIGNPSGPYGTLVKGDCIGCHGLGGSDKIKTIGDSKIPQILHTGIGDQTNGGDLAGGNFAYITGAKGTPGNDAYLDSKGHNVIDLQQPENNITATNPPGHHSFLNFLNRFTCAGKGGCHGARIIDGPGSSSGLTSLKGTHHANLDGQCNNPTSVATSYRFLDGVKGYENQDATGKWQNKSATSHNEYFGDIKPLQIITGSCSSNCHDPVNFFQVRPTNGTISAFCASCHGNFHLSPGRNDGSGDPGVGNYRDANQTPITPFLRHPTDVLLDSPTGVSNEYASYNPNGSGQFSTEAPIARTTVPNAASSTVTPGSDIVTCLSCHGAHATNYPDMLRWDYSQMLSANADINTGCFICHTAKDNP